MEEFFAITGYIRIKDFGVDYAITDRVMDDSYRPMSLCGSKISRDTVLEAVNNLFDKIEKGETIHEKYTEEELETLSQMVSGLPSLTKPKG